MSGVRRWCRTMVAVLLVCGPSGCGSWSGWRWPGQRQPPRELDVQVYLAKRTPTDGYPEQETWREQPIYVAAAPFLTHEDAAGVSGLHSDRRSVLVIEFDLIAAARLERTTREHLGELLLVRLDEKTVVATPIDEPLTDGRLGLDVGLARGEVDALVRGFAERKRTDAAPR